MKCPHCGFEEDKVVDSRPSHDGNSVRRRRQCLRCNQRFTTYEFVEHTTLIVLKSNDRREAFDRRKILQGIKLACNKRPVSSRKMEAMAEEVEAALNSQPGHEISAKQIGELVMEKLRSTDEIAYVRFASVYRKFKDKSEFLEEMKKLLE